MSDAFCGYSKRFFFPNEKISQLLIVGICLAAAAIMIPVAPVFQADSSSYLDFIPGRTAGYPLLLRAFGARGIVILQPMIFAAALAGLALEMLKVSQSPLVALAYCLVCLINPEVNIFHVTILTESIFMTFCLLFLTATLRFIRLTSLQSLLFASLFAGLAAITRPTGYALLPVLAFMVLMPGLKTEGRRLALLLAALLPLLTLGFAERLATNAYHGAEATSLAGRHYYAKAALLEAPPAASGETDPHAIILEQALDERFASIRNLLRHQTRWDVRQYFSENYETCLEYACVSDLRTTIALPAPAFNEMALRVGLARIQRAPLAFLALTWDHYLSLWTMYKAQYPYATPFLNTTLKENNPLPFANLAEFPQHIEPRFLAMIVRPAIQIIGFLTAALALVGLASVLLRRPLRAPLAAATLSSLSLHSCLMFTAILGVGIPRYTLSMWPIMMTAVILVSCWCATRMGLIFHTVRI